MTLLSERMVEAAARGIALVRWPTVDWQDPKELAWAMDAARAALTAALAVAEAEGDAVTDECRPPEGTPDGTVCVLQYGFSGVDYTPIWVTGTYHWPHPTIVGTVVAYMPEELAAAGWRFHSIAEPPADE